MERLLYAIFQRNVLYPSQILCIFQAFVAVNASKPEMLNSPTHMIQSLVVLGITLYKIYVIYNLL